MRLTPALTGEGGARLGYGFALRGLPGMLTLYSEVSGGESDRYQLGLNWTAASRFELNLYGERRAGRGDTENTILLEGKVSF